MRWFTRIGRDGGVALTLAESVEKKGIKKMTVIKLARKSHVRSQDGGSDLRVYVTGERDKRGTMCRYSLGIRVSTACMKRLRWKVGDSVSADFDDEKMTWTLRRVTADCGNRLSGQGKGGQSGTVRFAVGETQVKAFGLSLGEGHDAELASEDHEGAVFAIRL